MIEERGSGGVLQATYTYGSGIDEVLTMDRASQRYYYFHDGLGSTSDLTLASGEIVESYSYDAYGQPSAPSTVGNPYMFTGREYDQESGLYYYRARFYHPGIGRFMQRDPIFLPAQATTLNLGPERPIFDLIIGPLLLYLGTKKPTNLHPYLYTTNNPTNFVDPLGLYESRFKFINDMIEEKIEERLKETFPTMPDDTRREMAHAFRKEMTSDELDLFQNKNIPDIEKRRVAEEIARRAANDPKNRDLKEKAEPYVPEEGRSANGHKKGCNKGNSQ